MQIVIIAGGLATRLYPITQKIPKSMIEIGGRPFLEWQIKLLKKNKIKDIVLCVGNMSDQIKEYFKDGKEFGVNLRYSQEKPDQLLGTGGALKNAETMLEDIFMVTWGDSYLDLDYQKAQEFFLKKNKLGMMSVWRNRNEIEPSNVEIQKDLVKSYSKKRKTKKMEYIDYGLMIFKKEALKYLPKNKKSDFSILNQALIKRKQLLAYDTGKRYYQIGNFQGLQEFEELVNKKKIKF